MRYGLFAVFIFSVSAAFVPLQSARATLIIDPDGEVTLSGENKGSTDPGSRPEAAQHAKDYDGEETVIAKYSVNEMKDVNGKFVFVAAGSNVIFSVTKYTDKGEEVDISDHPFITLPIDITSADIDPVTGDVLTISFTAVNWYDPAANGGNLVISNTLSGFIDVLKEIGEINSSYKDKNVPTDVYRYFFEDVDSRPSKGAPEPPAWTIMLAGIGILIAARTRARWIAGSSSGQARGQARPAMVSWAA